MPDHPVFDFYRDAAKDRQCVISHIQD